MDLAINTATPRCRTRLHASNIFPLAFGKVTDRRGREGIYVQSTRSGKPRFLLNTWYVRKQGFLQCSSLLRTTAFKVGRGRGRSSFVPRCVILLSFRYMSGFLPSSDSDFEVGHAALRHIHSSPRSGRPVGLLPAEKSPLLGPMGHETGLHHRSWINQQRICLLDKSHQEGPNTVRIVPEHLVMRRKETRYGPKKPEASGLLLMCRQLTRQRKVAPGLGSWHRCCFRFPHGKGEPAGGQQHSIRLEASFHLPTACEPFL